MRSLCASTEFDRVQDEICNNQVSLGSFSEAQAVVEPELLQRVFGRLLERMPEDRQLMLNDESLKLIDSSVWQVLDRMDWAFWRKRTGGKSKKSDSALRLHVEFDLHKGCPSRIEVSKAKKCERLVLRKWAKANTIYIGDRYYSYNYTLLAELIARSVGFIVRLRIDSQWVVEQELDLSEEDKAASVVYSAMVRLGKKGNGPLVRIIQIAGEEESILLATTLKQKDAPSGVIAELYRKRWEIELFFRWIKCTLGNCHWLSESHKGVTIQIYLALIIFQLLVLFNGKAPNKRQMEAIQMYIMGWATADELTRHLKKYAPKKRN